MISIACVWISFVINKKNPNEFRLLCIANHLNFRIYYTIVMLLFWQIITHKNEYLPVEYIHAVWHMIIWRCTNTLYNRIPKNRCQINRKASSQQQTTTLKMGGKKRSTCRIRNGIIWVVYWMVINLNSTWNFHFNNASTIHPVKTHSNIWFCQTLYESMS